ncbi:MAG: hypothetical protein R3C18_18425 [Planctomycetaceae bacterium]
MSIDHSAWAGGMSVHDFACHAHVAKQRGHAGDTIRQQIAGNLNGKASQIMSTLE